MTLPIVNSPDPRLHEVSRPVAADEFGETLATHMNAMIETMYANRGMGLAGVQVGDMRRIMIITIGQVPVRVCNPEIVKVSRLRTPLVEGCLSFPGKHNVVNRSRQVTFTYQDPRGNFHTQSLLGMDARCFLHELDHLDGKTIL